MLTIGFVASLKKKKEVTLKRIFNRGKNLLIPSIWVGAVLLIVQIAGFSLLVIPLIILSVYLIFAKLAVILDAKRGFDALVYSFDLVRGYWWSVAIKSMALFASIISIMVILISGLVFIPNQVFIDFVLSGVLTLVITPMFLIFLYTLYEDIKSKPRIEKKSSARKIVNIAAVIGSVIAILFSVLIISVT
jgi:hypothetical protein